MGIGSWLKKIFLPFEDPSHPLYAPKYEEPDYSDDELYGWLDDLGPSKYPLSKRQLKKQQERENTRQGMIGPNYARSMGDKPAEYLQWGNKWYKKSK